jgi:hypothetical protein
MLNNLGCVVCGLSFCRLVLVLWVHSYEEVVDRGFDEEFSYDVRPFG